MLSYGIQQVFLHALPFSFAFPSHNKNIGYCTHADVWIVCRWAGGFGILYDNAQRFHTTAGVGRRENRNGK